jgi:hypothetical protein
MVTVAAERSHIEFSAFVHLALSLYPYGERP